MNARASDLPDYASPPVTEVVISLQFEPVGGLRAVHLGLLWQEFRERYPRTEEHPPLAPVFEAFPGTGQPRISVQFQVLDAPPVPRVWFLNDPGTRLLQVQQDRFIHNWRKVGEGGAYPRYEGIRQTFADELEVFRRFLEREGLGTLRPNQCEVTYLNHIVPGECWQRPGQLEGVVTVWASGGSDGFLPEPEEARLTVCYVIPGPGGAPIGRLHGTLSPARRKADGQPILVLDLTARGRPSDEEIEGALGFIDLGREWIVRGFTSLTTPCQHRAWGRTNV
jgi:hypothetical protein